MLDRYVIKNGSIMSIMDGSIMNADILVENGVITRIENNISVPDAEVIPANGMFVTVGWLDAHCHFAGVGDAVSLSDVTHLLEKGVTYAVDLGTLGPDNYAEHRTKLLYRTDLRFMSYLYMADRGVLTGGTMDFSRPEDITPDKIRRTVREYSSEILGLKIRIDEKFCFDPVYVLNITRKMADELQLPMVVHAPRCNLGIEQVLSYLRHGDVLAHTLAGNNPAMGILNEDGTVKECVLQARERGVIFDLSHGTNAYSYEAAEAAWRAGFFVDTISSDLHMRNVNGPVYDLATVLTKVRGLTGMPWHQILNLTIAAPVRLQHLKGKALEIKEGMTADLTIFGTETGEFTYLDSKKVERTFSERIKAHYTCVGSHIYVCH